MYFYYYVTFVYRCLYQTITSNVSSEQEANEIRYNSQKVIPTARSPKFSFVKYFSIINWFDICRRMYGCRVFTSNQPIKFFYENTSRWPKLLIPCELYSNTCNQEHNLIHMYSKCILRPLKNVLAHQQSILCELITRKILSDCKSNISTEWKPFNHMIKLLHLDL